MTSSVYACTHSGIALQRSGNLYCNERGESVAETREGVVWFESTSVEEDQATRTRLSQLHAAAVANGWRAALTESYEPAFVDYVTNPLRSRFIDELPLSSSSDVLEIGPGLGQFTGELAARCRFVDALEVVPGQAVFIALKMKQEGIANVRVAAGGGDCRLPYRDQAFDGVVLNLVFEWCGARAAEEHLVVQLRLLSEMFRVLRPGGFLYLATKNRFGISYVAGKPDEHFEGMRFGSALPRRLARLAFGGKQPGMLHSYPGLRRLIASSGFRVEKSWWAAPDYRRPLALIDTDSTIIRDARQSVGFIAGRSRLERLVLGSLPASWVKYFMPGLNFLAVKPGTT
jgi:SAM-dependent methyltransferase